MKTQNLTTAKKIESFGTTGIYVDGQLNEEMDIDSFDKIIDLLDDNNVNYEWQYTHENDEDMPQDEWTITIKNK